MFPSKSGQYEIKIGVTNAVTAQQNNVLYHADIVCHRQITAGVGDEASIIALFQHEHCIVSSEINIGTSKAGPAP